MESYGRRGRLEGVNEDHPIYSRLFVVCGKNTTEEQLREDFDKFGTIEDFYTPLDHKTGAHKGIAFIKFSKTSEAAKAVQEMHLKSTPGRQRLKVIVASSRSDIQTDDGMDDPDKYKRLFIYVQKSATEEQLAEYFSKFGHVSSAIIQRNRDTDESKGFAYITYNSFYEAALAFEGADKAYRAIFAQPKKQHRPKPQTSFESNLSRASNVSLDNTLLPMMNVQPQGYRSVIVNCAPLLSYYQIQNLFDLVPGMVNCVYSVDMVRHFGKGQITYSSPVSAAYAVQKLDDFEYPPGHRMMVKPDYSSFKPEQKFDEVPSLVRNLNSAIQNASKSVTPDLAQLATAIAEASKLIKTATLGITDQDLPDSDDLNYCSVQLPPPQPLAHIDAPVAKRCFLVCRPQPPPLKVLRDVFCRFGDLINVYTLPNKTVGYVRYASVRAADDAMKVLHGAELCGIRIKVLEAEDEDRSAGKRKRYD